MKKRVLSLLLALALCFSMLPMAVLAEEAGETTVQTAQSGADAADGNTVDAGTVGESVDEDNVDESPAAPDDEDGGITLFAGHTGDHGFTLPEGETWQGITSLSSISGAGYYYLTKNVKVYAKKWEPKNGVVLDLNGYTLSSIYSGDFNNGVITIGKGVTFTLTDCNGSGNGKGIVTRDSGQNGRGVYVAGGGVFYMYVYVRRHHLRQQCQGRRPRLRRRRVCGGIHQKFRHGRYLPYVRRRHL